MNLFLGSQQFLKYHFNESGYYMAYFQFTVSGKSISADSISLIAFEKII
jgi:hypothetical protein